LSLLNAGYFQTTIFPRSYWNTLYWQTYGAAGYITALPLEPGYWQPSYWMNNYWHPLYWQKYGTTVISGGDSALYYYGLDRKKKKVVDVELLFLLKNYLEQT
jgi:hypothetical protein